MKALGGCMLLTFGASIPYWPMAFSVFAQATPSDVVQIGQQAWNLGPLTFLVFMFLLFLVIFIWLLIRANGEQRAIWLAEKKTSDARYEELKKTSDDRYETLVKTSDAKHAQLSAAQNEIAGRFTVEVAAYRTEATQTTGKLIELVKESTETLTKVVSVVGSVQASVEELRGEVARIGSTPVKAIATEKPEKVERRA